ncbi:MAG: hypothetical protein DHS20C20_30920 [Ardenticatenaceae bacterium]|nr:MAG: hypothetical protein DHS20C20_30920 [Ardenticatenaceae bacterium]
MNWTSENQAQFDDLRQREIMGSLTQLEQQELDSLMVALTQAADDALLPAIHRLQQEQAKLETRLKQQQHKNEELAKHLLQDKG